MPILDEIVKGSRPTKNRVGDFKTASGVNFILLHNKSGREGLKSREP